MEVTPALMNALGVPDEDAATLALGKKRKAPATITPEPSTEDISDEDDVVDDRVSHLLEDALDRKVHEMLVEEAGESDEDLVAFVIHLAREADDRDAFLATLKAAAQFRDDFAKAAVMRSRSMINLRRQRWPSSRSRSCCRETCKLNWRRRGARAV